MRPASAGQEAALGYQLRCSRTLGTAARIALEIEKLPDGRCMVYIPSAPSVWSGVTQILPADQITYLDIPITSVMELTERFGHGVDELLQSIPRWLSLYFFSSEPDKSIGQEYLANLNIYCVI